MKDLTPRTDGTGVQTINLRELGFVGRVSDKALAEIEAMEREQRRLFAHDRTVFD
jgi:hypothetical protein